MPAAEANIEYWISGPSGSSKNLVELLSEDAELLSEISVFWQGFSAPRYA